jgi:8-oxo-dGTP pyrophosphatase MutT (NUDIX family)
MTHELRLRPAVRGLVMDADNCVLMVRLVFPHGAFWVLPGGGIDDGEDHMEALHRELLEETGLVDASIGEPVWKRIHHFQLIDTSGVEWSGQTETVYMVRTERFAPAPSFTEEQLRAENLHSHRWWSIQELLAYNGDDKFTPRDIASFLHLIIHEGIPEVPFMIEHRTENSPGATD